MRSTLSSGTRVQYTQPPNGSLNGTPSIEHQRAAHAARPDAAQRHALRGRMRRQAAGAPEQAEGRHLPQHVVGHHGRRLPDGLLVDDVDAGRARRRAAARCVSGVTVTVSNNVAGLQHHFDVVRGAETDCDLSANPPARTTIVGCRPGRIDR